jgi:hypothetical protein
MTYFLTLYLSSTQSLVLATLSIGYMRVLVITRMVLISVQEGILRRKTRVLSSAPALLLFLALLVLRVLA